MRRGTAIYATRLLKRSAKNVVESFVTNTLDYAALVESISAQNVAPLRASLTRVLSDTAARNSAALWLRDCERNWVVLESVLSPDPLKGPGHHLSCRWEVVQRGFGPFQPSYRIFMPAKVTHQVKPQLMHRYLCCIDRRSLNEWRKLLFQSPQQLLFQLQDLFLSQNFHRLTSASTPRPL